jgi:hypothetical protein
LVDRIGLCLSPVVPSSLLRCLVDRYLLCPCFRCILLLLLLSHLSRRGEGEIVPVSSSSSAYSFLICSVAIECEGISRSLMTNIRSYLTSIVPLSPFLSAILPVIFFLSIFCVRPSSSPWSHSSSQSSVLPVALLHSVVLMSSLHILVINHEEPEPQTS